MTKEAKEVKEGAKCNHSDDCGPHSYFVTDDGRHFLIFYCGLCDSYFSVEGAELGVGQ